MKHDSSGRSKDCGGFHTSRRQCTVISVMSSWRKSDVTRPLAVPASSSREGEHFCLRARDTLASLRNFRRRALCSGSEIGPKKFAEPVSLSSALPTNFRLPPTAARLGFDLLALRARRKRDSRGVKGSLQGLSQRRVRNLQKIQFSTFSTGRDALLWISLGNSAEKRGAPRPRTCSDLRREPPTSAKARVNGAGSRTPRLRSCQTGRRAT
jgi:hypothetical protein